MLSLPEFRASMAKLQKRARITEATIKAQTRHLDVQHPTYSQKNEAAHIAKKQSQTYHNQFRQILNDHMTNVANTSLEHYAKQLNLRHDPNRVDDLVKNQYDSKYYGATLNQRLYNHSRQLATRANKSALMHPRHVANILTKSIPFGSQLASDKMLMLSTSSKIENDAVKLSAKLGQAKLIRWKLSHIHEVEDICDSYATQVNPAVKKYLKESTLDIDPAGVYFASELPHPPHPNCQCEYILITDKQELTQEPVTRTLDKIQALLRNILQR